MPHSAHRAPTAVRYRIFSSQRFIVHVVSQSDELGDESLSTGFRFSSKTEVARCSIRDEAPGDVSAQAVTRRIDEEFGAGAAARDDLQLLKVEDSGQADRLGER